MNPRPFFRRLKEPMKQNVFIYLFVLLFTVQAFAVTKVKPLKIGSTGVAQEASQSTDYVSSKGFAFENSDSYTLDVQSSKIYALSDGVTAPVCQAPTSSTANNLALFNGTTGHLLKELAAGSNGDLLYYNSTTPAWGSLATAGVAPKDAEYFVKTTNSTLTNERALTFNSTNFSTTDLGAGNTFSVNTSQNIDTTASPTWVSPFVQRIIISGSTNQNFINASGTVDAATGDENGFTLDTTANKATSGTVRVIKSNFTKTSSPGLNYLMDLQKGGTSKFRVGEEGGLSITTATETHSLNVSSGTNTKLLSIVAPAYSTAASTEFTPITIDLSATHTFATGAFSGQRAIKILSPTYTMSSIDTLGTAATLSINGPPAGTGGINIDSSYGLEILARNVTSTVRDAIGLVVNAPTGAFGSNSAATFNGGNVGINTTAPRTYLHINPSDLDSSHNIVGIDGQTRYADVYFGGTEFTSVGAGGARHMIIDHGVNYPAATSFGQGTQLNLFNLNGSNNYTGAINNTQATSNISTGGGTATQINSLVGTISTSSVSNITTSRSVNASATFAGSGAVATHVGHDTSVTISGSALTDVIGFRFGLPVVSSGSLTTVTGVDILDQTQTATNKYGIRQRGTTGQQNVFAAALNMFGDNSTAAHLIEAKNGNIAITNSGTAGELRIYEASGSGTNYSAFKAQPQAGNLTYTLPAADGASGDSLTTNGSGTLSWTTVSGGGGTQTVWLASKGADTSRNTTTTLAADPDLDLTVSWANSQKYIVEGAIFFTSANATPDFDFQWQGPAITAGSLRIRYYNIRNNSSSVADSEDETAFVNAGTAGDTIAIVAGAIYNLQFSGQFTTSGTPGSNHLQFQWAQNISDANNVTVQAGSWMKVSKVQ